MSIELRYALFRAKKKLDNQWKIRAFTSGTLLTFVILTCIVFPEFNLFVLTLFADITWGISTLIVFLGTRRQKQRIYAELRFLYDAIFAS